MITKRIDRFGDLVYETSVEVYHNPHGPAVRGKNRVEYIINHKPTNIVGPCIIGTIDNELYTRYCINRRLINNE